MVDILNDPDADTGNGQPPPEAEWQSIFQAPDFTQLVKPRVTAKSREYTGKVNSVLKTGLVGAINAKQFPDAAAILAYGPQFSAAAGTLADHDEKVAKAIDLITSPSNPYAMFIMSAIPLFGQFYRNHETAINDAPGNFRAQRARKKAMRKAGAPPPPPRFTIKIGKRTIPVRFGVRLRVLGSVLRGIRHQTDDPATLTEMVFTDPDLLKALEKQGIKLVHRETS